MWNVEENRQDHKMTKSKRGAVARVFLQVITSTGRRHANRTTSCFCLVLVCIEYRQYRYCFSKSLWTCRGAIGRWTASFDGEACVTHVAKSTSCGRSCSYGQIGLRLGRVGCFGCLALNSPSKPERFNLRWNCCLSTSHNEVITLMFSTFSTILWSASAQGISAQTKSFTPSKFATHIFLMQFCWISQHPKNRKHEHQRFQHFRTTVELNIWWESSRFVLVWARDKGLGQVSSKTLPFSALGCILLSFYWHHLQYDLSLSHLHRSWVKPRALKKAWLSRCEIDDSIDSLIFVDLLLPQAALPSLRPK